MAVCALIFSRIDYCNSLYFGINSNLLNKLQYVQNSAARLIRNTNSTEDIIRKCHWLKVKERIVFKVALMVHKCLNGIAPSVLSDMLLNVYSKRTMKLEQYRYKGAFGNRCFARIAPKVWNLLPQVIRGEKDIEKFKSLLKTFLFDGFATFEQKLKEH